MYTHIFTEGIDTIVSASIWLPVYGGNDACIFGQNGKMKGYVSNVEVARLGDYGYQKLQDNHFVSQCMDEAVDCQKSMEHFIHEDLNTLSIELLYTRFIDVASLLKRSYGIYFYTEEFYTSKLSLDVHKEIISKIGKFRLDFISTCLGLTQHIYQIVSAIGTFENIISTDMCFFTYDEIVDGSYRLRDISDRKIAYFIRQHKQKLQCIYGNDAVQEYTRCIPTNVVKEVEGSVASQGIVTGNVYIISLTDFNIDERITKMPPGSILVSESTQPRMSIACQKASGIVTDEGGVLSHAAIISRELHIPCIVGCHNATDVLKDGMRVTLNGTTGCVTIIS